MFNILGKYLLSGKNLGIGVLLFTFYIGFGQNKIELSNAIQDLNTFDEISKKLDKKLNKHKLSFSYFRNLFLDGELEHENLDNDRLRFERWKWYWKDRVTEDGHFPDLERQWIIYNTLQKNPGKTLRANAQWKSEGPVKNTGGYWGMGRTTHIAFHPTLPNTFYLASPNGGLWKSSDGGTTYISIGDNLPYQPVGIVVADPVHTNTLYITLGEKEGWWQYSMGVYKSKDGGQSWTPTGLNWKLTDNRVIFGLEMNPLDPAILIAATSAGLYKTFNGGDTWTRVRTENFSDVKFKPGDTSTVYAAINDYWGACNILKSTDGGNNFAISSSFTFQKAFFRLATTEADPEYLGINMSIDGQRKFYLSQNSGSSFYYMSDMPENLVMAFSQQNKQIMYCGYVVLYKSTNGGRTWNQITDWWASGQGLPEIHADHHWIGFHPTYKNEIFFCCDGGLYKFNENTSQWTELVNGLVITQFYKMAVSNTQVPVLIGGSQDNGGFIRRTNGTWGNTNGGDAMDQLIDPNNVNIGYTEYWGGTAVYRTYDGFKTLVEISTNIPGKPQGNWVTPFTLNPKNSKTFIIGYEDVFVSHDRGTTFYTISKQLTGAADKDLRDVEVNPSDTNHIAACYANIFYSTKDFGKTWKSFTMVGSAEITGICFDPNDQNKMWVCRGGYGNIKVFASKDKGNTWINISKNLPVTPASCILLDEVTNTLFIGTDLGVFYTDADQINWEYYGVGLPHTSVTDLDIHQLSRQLYVSTYGRGMYSIPLPECYPTQLNLSGKINQNNYTIQDTLSVCMGDFITLKTLDGISGNFNWKGPNLDILIVNKNELVLGKIVDIEQEGLYTIQYESEEHCKKEESMYIKVNSLPVAHVQQDSTELNCAISAIQLTPLESQLPDYNYQWYESTKLISNSYAHSATKEGLYVLKVIDNASKCFVQDTINLVRVLDPKFEFSKVDISCYEKSDGQILLRPSLGKQPYHFSGQSILDDTLQFNLAGGIYIVQLIDANQCLYTDTIEIVRPDSLSIDLVISPRGDNKSDIEAQVKGGTGIYHYSWIKDNTVFDSIKNLQVLEPGFYSLIVSDDNSCSKEIKFQVKEFVAVNEEWPQSISIFPNPAVHTIFIENCTLFPGTTIRLSSMEGKIVPVQSKQVGNRVQISWPEKVSGFYVLSIQRNEKQKEWVIEIIQK